MKKPKMYPIILAAGGPTQLGFPKPLAPFGGKNALQIAVENCSGLERPVVVLGYQAARIRAVVPRGTRVVVNRRWSSGQLSSLLAGLRAIPRDGAFLVYPVDHPLLTPALIRRLVSAFNRKPSRYKVVLPRIGRRVGHPVIFSAEMRPELRNARTARQAVYRDRSRIQYVSVRTPAIFEDYDSPASYYRCLRKYHPRRG